MSVDPVARLANLVMSEKAEYGPHILFPAPLDNAATAVWPTHSPSRIEVHDVQLSRGVSE